MSDAKPAMDWKPAIRAVILMVAPLVLVAVCVQLAPKNTEENDRATLANQRERMCTAEAERVALNTGAMRRVDPGLGLIVDREAWDRLEYEHKEWVAAWACICKYGGEQLSVKDSRTHKRLAWYSPTMGFHAE